MQAHEIIEWIRSSRKRTPVRVHLKSRIEIPFENVQRFPMARGACILFGDWGDIAPMLERHAEDIEEIVIENSCRNSALPLLDTKEIHARIEPGAIIRDRAEIGDHAVIMMGAVINTGAQIGAGTMIDMNAVVGGGAIVGGNCHVGAGAVLAGAIEPACAEPVRVEDDVFIGANAVVLEGVRIGRGAVIAAGAVVTRDVPPDSVAAGMPARIIKQKDGGTCAKTAAAAALREL